MSIEKENGIITLMRGDSFTTPIYINIGTKLSPIYKTLTSYERLYFGLMEPGQAFEDAVLKKVFDWTSPTDADGNTLLRIVPKDTEKLLVGKYYYMIKLRTMDSFNQEMVKTIVSPTLFWLQGNNPKKDIVERHEEEEYQIDNVIIEGGEIDDTEVHTIIYEGGEIV